MPFTIKIKKATECTEQEIDAFYELVLLGGQVDKNGLKQRIRNAHYLGFAYSGEMVVGIMAIKMRNEPYKDKIFIKAETIEISKDYSYEIGYAFTLEEFRRNGISNELLKALLMKEDDFYAFTGNKAMIKLFEKFNFEKLGKPYKGIYNDELNIYGLMKKIKKNDV